MNQQIWIQVLIAGIHPVFLHVCWGGVSCCVTMVTVYPVFPLSFLPYVSRCIHPSVIFNYWPVFLILLIFLTVEHVFVCFLLID